MKRKAILFDLDGTLTDSGEGIINCAALALKRFGLEVPSREVMRVFVGPPLPNTFIEFGIPPEKVDEAIAIFRSRYIPIGAYENCPYPGIEQMLIKLNELGYSLYVATSKPEEMAIKIMNHFGLSQYFAKICGATFDHSRTSKEAVIEYLLDQCKDLDDIVMVGDTAFDVIGAKVHGIPTVGVAWGYGKVSDMVAAGAASIAHSVEELFELLTA